MDYEKFYSYLKTLISFKSVEGKPSENAPFGIETRKALDYFLSLAKDMGFETINYDGYGGEVIVGEGEEIGILGHLDVVPTNLGWNTDPFTLTEIDGKLYARGVEDDKGPTLISLLALKSLVDDGVKFNRKIRLIVGTDEESGWKDIEYMKTKTKFPKYGFSPDGNFPVTYAEKGIYWIKINLPKLDGFYDFTGGTVINAVCDYASIMTEKEVDNSLIKELGLKYTNGKIESFGVAAHGSAPHKGKNAFRAIFKYLEGCKIPLNNLVEKLFDDGIGIASLENQQGKTTISPDLIIKTDGGYQLTCDCRLPAPFTVEALYPLLDKLGLEYSIEERHPPFMVDKDGFLIKALNDAYNQVMKTDSKPLSMGGSTFARVFEQGCAFGIGDDEETGGAHEANEFVSVKHLKNCFEIYKKSIYNLVK